MKAKKIYVDEMSNYIEIEFDNGEKHQISTFDSGETPDEGFDKKYKCEIIFEDK